MAGNSSLVEVVSDAAEGDLAAFGSSSRTKVDSCWLAKVRASGRRAGALQRLPALIRMANSRTCAPGLTCLRRKFFSSWPASSCASCAWPLPGGSLGRQSPACRVKTPATRPSSFVAC